MVLESPVLERTLSGREPPAADLRFPSPLVRDARLARRFLALHRALETPSWALEREELLSDWLRDVGDGTPGLDDRRRSARRDPALRRACELLGVGVAEVAQATGFFDQSHLHRHFRRTLGMTPARYARLTAQTYKTRARG